jgi:hypothetical protein
MYESKYTIDDIKEMISEDSPIIRTEIAIPLDTLIEDITSYDDFYDYFDDAICDSYLPKVDCSYEFLRTEYVGHLLLIYEVEIELDYEAFMEE